MKIVTTLVLCVAFVAGLSECTSVQYAHTPYGDALLKGDAATVRSMLDQGLAWSSKISEDPAPQLPLVAAVTGGNIEIVKLLLQRGAPVNGGGPLNGGGKSNCTPLHSAAYEGRIDIIKLLIASGADLYAQCYGMTPEKRARTYGQDAAADYLARVMAGPTPQVIEPAPVAPAPVSAPAIVKASLAPGFSDATRADDYAVIVGIENYPDLPAATFAERDAAAAKSFIRALGVPERNIVLLTGSRATKSGLEKTIEDWLPNNVSEKSQVYFYYSGHGAPDPKSGSAYLLPSDGDPQYLARTGYPLKQLYFQLGQLKAKHVLVALDSCFSGAGGRSVVAKDTRPLVGKVDMSVQADGKLSVISASAGDQTSGANEEAGYGLFTYNFLQGLNGAAKDAQGRMTLQSLYGYIKPRVQDDARRANRDQTPQLQGDGSWPLR